MGLSLKKTERRLTRRAPNIGSGREGVAGSEHGVEGHTHHFGGIAGREAKAGGLGELHVGVVRD